MTGLGLSSGILPSSDEPLWRGGLSANSLDETAPERGSTLRNLLRAVLQVNDLELDRISHGVQRQGRQIDLSPKEFCLLELLMRHVGQPVSRSANVEQVWKLNCDTMTNVVDVYINYLRRKVDVGFEIPLIRTVRGVGYQIGASFAGCD